MDRHELVVPFRRNGNPGRPAEATYAFRHSIRAGSEGFAFPPLSIRPLGRQIRLDWRPLRPAMHKVEFVSEGSAVLEAAHFRDFLTRLVSVVLDRLDHCQVGDTLLEEEWATIQSADVEEAEFCMASAALGLDPYSLDEAGQEAILAAGQLLPSEVSSDFFAAAEARLLRAQAQYVADAIRLSRANPSDLAPLKGLRQELVRFHHQASTPWEGATRPHASCAPCWV